MRDLTIKKYTNFLQSLYKTRNFHRNRVKTHHVSAALVTVLLKRKDVIKKDNGSLYYLPNVKPTESDTIKIINEINEYNKVSKTKSRLKTQSNVVSVPPKKTEIAEDYNISRAIQLLKENSYEIYKISRIKI